MELFLKDECNLSCFDDLRVPILLVDCELKFLYENSAFAARYPALSYHGTLSDLFSDYELTLIRGQVGSGAPFVWTGRLGKREWDFLFQPFFHAEGGYLYTQVTPLGDEDFPVSSKDPEENFFRIAVKETLAPAEHIQRALTHLDRLPIYGEAHQYLDIIRQQTIRIQYVAGHAAELDSFPPPEDTPSGICEVARCLEIFSEEFPMLAYTKRKGDYFLVPLPQTYFGEIVSDCCSFLLSSQAERDKIRVLVHSGQEHVRVTLTASHVSQAMAARKDLLDLSDPSGSLRLAMRRAKLLAERYSVAVETKYFEGTQKLRIHLRFPAAIPAREGLCVEEALFQPYYKVLRREIPYLALLASELPSVH